jgi:hypothetical protein
VPDEHVLTQAAFGEFNFVIDCVCPDCNHTFGKTLELAIQHHSMEAVLRFNSGLVSGRLDGMTKNLEIRVADEGPWKGVRFNLEARKGQKGARAILIPQFAARQNAQAEWHWFTIKEISPDLATTYRDFMVVATTKKQQEAIIARLKRAGIDFRPKGNMQQPFGPDGKVGATLEAFFSEQIQRCIAKQSFNYLAKVMGAEFVLRDDFDAVRCFILTGTKQPFKVVRPMRPGASFIVEERYGGRATTGHIMSVDWSANRRSIVSRAAFFNSMKYIVVLSDNYSGIWIPNLQHAHHFDISTRAVKLLGTTNLVIPKLTVVVSSPLIRVG